MSDAAKPDNRSRAQKEAAYTESGAAKPHEKGAAPRDREEQRAERDAIEALAHADREPVARQPRDDGEAFSEAQKRQRVVSDTALAQSPRKR